MESTFEVGPLTVEDLLTGFLRLATETFSGSDEVDARTALFRELDEKWPDFHPSQRRGVIEDGRLLGGYIMHERRMRMGPARLSTACIGAVVTTPEARGRGVGRAMMEDAVRHAQARGHALMLLDGIAGFYSRFGYTDVFDPTVGGIDAAAIPKARPARYHVRPATVDDAPAMLDLYGRHYGRYLGSFDWTLEHERLRLWLPIALGDPTLVAEDAQGSVQGYLHVDENSNRAIEAAVDTHGALIVLLQHHGRASNAPPGEQPAIWWQLPPDSPTAYMLGECLKSEKPDRHRPALRMLCRQERDSGWLARPADVQVLMHQIAPLLSERWKSSCRPYGGSISVRVGEESFSWTVGDDAVDIEVLGTEACCEVTLTAQAFTQLVFAYRPVWWVAQEDDVQIAPHLVPVLDILFPVGGFTIAGTDAF